MQLYAYLQVITWSLSGVPSAAITNDAVLIGCLFRLPVNLGVQLRLQRVCNYGYTIWLFNIS